MIELLTTGKAVDNSILQKLPEKQIWFSSLRINLLSKRIMELLKDRNCYIINVTGAL